MEIKVLNDSVSYKKEGNTHILDFGNLQHKAKAEAMINISGVENLTLSATCGCTVIQADKNGDAKIAYNRTENRGTFVKTINVNYKKDGKKQQSEIKIKGNVN
jgi:hypothetical protein